MSGNAPKSGEYQDGKLWFTRKASIVTIGLTDLAIEDIGTVEKVEFPDEDQDFVKGEAIATVAGSQGKIEVSTPATGMVTEVNSQAMEEPETVSDDPLEEGWLIKFEIQDKTELQEYASEEDEEG